MEEFITAALKLQLYQCKMATNFENENGVQQVPSWTISPADLDKLTRFCPENETSLLTMIEEGEGNNDPDVLENTQKISISMFEMSGGKPIFASPDSGFGGSQEFDNGQMNGVKKPEQVEGSGAGRGRGRARFVPPKKDEEEFIARQIQEVLRLDGAGSLSNKSHTSNKTLEEKREVAETADIRGPKNRGRGKRLKDGLKTPLN